MNFQQEIDVSIIIVNYNTCKLTVGCIRSIYERTKEVSFEIIVVDNASVDDSVIVLKQNFPGIKVIESKVNLGFGKANNLGVKYAGGIYLFLLNSDTILINNAINELLQFNSNEKNGNIGICGGNLYTKDLKPNHSYATIYPSLLNIIIYRGQLNFLKKFEVFNTTGQNKEVAIIIGADLFIRKSIFIGLNGFDPFYFMYIEDGDLCYTVRKAGYRIVSVPAAKIIHYQGKSSTTGNKLIMEVTSYIYYFRKHHNRFTVMAYKSIEFFFGFCKLLVSSIKLNREKQSAYLCLLKFLVSSNNASD